MNGNIRERLYNLETPPPQDAWQNIARMLDAEEGRQAPVVPIAQPPVRRFNYTRLALAAALIGFVVMTGLWIAERAKKKGTTAPVISSETTKKSGQDTTFNKDTGTGNNHLPPVTNLPDQPVAQQSNDTPPAVKENMPAYYPGTDPGKQARPNNDSKNRPPLPVNNTDKTQLAAEKGVVTPRSNDVAIASAVAKDSTGKVIQDIGVVKSSSGQGVAGPATKGDKSIASILSKISVSGDNEELDRIISESPYWRRKIQEWRDKLIKSGYTPTMLNMLDIAELQKLLKEDQ